MYMRFVVWPIKVFLGNNVSIMPSLAVLCMWDQLALCHQSAGRMAGKGACPKSLKHHSQARFFRKMAFICCDFFIQKSFLQKLNNVTYSEFWADKSWKGCGVCASGMIVTSTTWSPWRWCQGTRSPVRWWKTLMQWCFVKQFEHKCHILSH